MLFDRDRDLRLAAANALGRLREKSAGSILTAAAARRGFFRAPGGAGGAGRVELI